MKTTKLKINIASLIPVIFLFCYAIHTSFAQIPYEWGFGVGFALFNVFLFVLLSLPNTPRSLAFLAYVSLGFFGVSYLASVEFLNDPNPLAAAFSRIIYAFFWLHVVFIPLCYMNLCISAFVNSAMGKWWKYAKEPACRKVEKNYVLILLIGTLSSPVSSFSYAAIRSPGNPELFEKIYYATPGIIVCMIGTWLLLLVLTRRRKDDLELAGCIRHKGLAQFNIKKRLFIGIGVFLIICTFFEAFRGLWWVWLGTAIWIILMLASLWKIWKHIFDVPQHGEATEAP